MVNFTMLAHNRPRLTKQAIESLGEHPDCNVIVRADKWDDDETREILFDWSARNARTGRVVYHTTKYAGTGEARNDGIATSEQAFGRGDYLYLSDNDVFFKPGWLKTLILCYEAVWKHGFKVIGAYNHPYHQPVPPALLMGPGNIEVHQVHALALQSMLMKWEVWDKYGPFCKTEPGRVCQSEDVDFTNKIIADGGKIGVVSPALIVNTGITNSFGKKIPGWELVKAQCPGGVICE